jgi:hypothetical protein
MAQNYYYDDQNIKFISLFHTPQQLLKDDLTIDVINIYARYGMFN